MDRNTHAREGQKRAIAVFEARPNRAMVTNKGIATITDGLACIFADGTHSINIDMPEAIGGSGTAPSPGYFGRAAICSCIAIGIKMTAARENMALDSIRVSIEQDFDNRGVLGMPGAAAVPSGTRLAIEIASQEAWDKVDILVQKALKTDPWFLAFKDAQPVLVECMSSAETV